MALTSNIPDIMTPGAYAEYNYYAGPNGLPPNIQKVLLVGDISSEGSLAVAKPTAVFTEDEVITLCGAGSVLHQMYLSAKKAWKYASITVVRHAAVTGSAAAWSFKVASTGAKFANNGLVTLSIGADKVSAAIKTGETAADAIAALVDAVNANTALGVTAAVAEPTEEGGESVNHDDTIVLTAKSNGAYISADNGGIVVDCVTDTIDTEVTSNSTAGVGVVNIESALASVFSTRFHLIVPSVSDSANVALLKTHCETAADAIAMRGQRAIVALVSKQITEGGNTVSAAQNAINLALCNSERVNIFAAKTAIASSAWEIAAGVGAIFASNSRPNIPLNFRHIPGLAIPNIENKWSDDEMEALQRGGVSPLTDEDGELCIVRAVTTRTTKNGVAFRKLIDTGVIASLDYVRDSIVATQKIKFQNAVIHEKFPDAVNEENIATCKLLESDFIVRFVDQYRDDFITEESKNVPGRLLCRIPAHVVPGLMQIYNTIDLYLN